MSHGGAPPSPSRSARVLVAEDEPHIRRILVTLLESADLEMDIVNDGSAALAAVRGDVPYDLMLLDLVMPGASGLEVLAELRSLAHRAALPVIVLTAKGQDVDRKRALSLGADVFLTKPFSPRKLLGHMDALLGRS
jgi:DNA-binding response OmpR family regulator